MFKKKENKKERMSLDLSFISLLLGVFILVCPILRIMDLTFILRLFYGSYAIVSLIQFVINKDKKEYSNLFEFMVSMLLLIVSFIWNLVGTSKVFALSLLAWIICNVFIKLKKADYYNDRHSRIWIMEISFLGLFLLSGVLTCLNLVFEGTAAMLSFGYFTLISGIFKVLDHLIIYLTNGRLK